MIQDVVDIMKRIDDIKARFGLKNHNIAQLSQSSQSVQSTQDVHAVYSKTSGQSASLNSIKGLSFQDEIENRINEVTKDNRGVTVREDAVSLSDAAEKIAATEGLSSDGIKSALDAASGVKNKTLFDLLNMGPSQNGLTGDNILKENAGILNNYLGQNQGDYKKAVEAYLKMKQGASSLDMTSFDETY